MVKSKNLNEYPRQNNQEQEKNIFQSLNAEKKLQHLNEGGFIEEANVFKKIIEFAKVIKEAGGKALLVGGCVRDELLGFLPKDYDIEVYNIPPDKLKKLVNSFGQVNEVGAAFGILKVRIGNIDVDISLPRRESKTGKGHKDFSVNADPKMSIKEAARRRDFTFNSLAKDILTGEIYDYFGGIKDIEQRILRVTDEERFRDDPLRVLRGMQFVGRFGLKIDDSTARIMREMRTELKFLPKERLREEWLKLFLRSKKPSLGLQAAMEWGIFHEMHPEIAKLPTIPQEPEWHPEGDVWIHSLMVVDEAAKIIEQEQLNSYDATLIILASFCHDFGKIITTKKEPSGKIRSIGHETAGIELTHKFLLEIGIEASLRDPIAKLVANHLEPSLLYLQEKKGVKITEGAIKRLATRINPANLKHLICVAKADHLGRGFFVDPKEPEKSLISLDYPAGEWLLKKSLEIGVYEKKPSPVLFGRDLIALGFKPSPLFGKVIQIAEEMHVKGLSREEILTKIFKLKKEQNISLEDLINVLK